MTIPRRTNTDLIIVGGITLIAMVLALLHANLGIVQMMFALPLVFILPGYAIMVAIFPRRPFTVETLVFTIGVSISITILVGLLLNFTAWGLLPEAWVVYLGDGTLAMTLVALARRWQHADENEKMPIRFSRRSLGLFGLAGVLVVVAYGLSSAGAQQSDATQFTQLWMTPLKQNTVSVAVRNDETSPMLYRLQVVDGSTIVKEWSSIPLDPGQEWQAQLDVPPSSDTTHPLEADLYRQDSPNTVYRHVSLAQ